MKKFEAMRVIDRKRFKYVLGAQYARRPLAALALFVVAVGLIENLILTAQGGTLPTTHPATAFCIASLCVGILNFRRNVPTPMWRYLLSCGCLLLCLLNLLDFTPVTPLFGPLAGVYHGEMGRDTALVLAALFASVILRRHAGRSGLVFCLVGFATVVTSFVGHSFGVIFLDDQMSLATLSALLLLSGSVMTLYAHRPFVRVVLFSGSIGHRTRVMAAVGFLVPLISGLVLYRGVGIPHRPIPVEAIVLTVIIWSTVITAVYSGFLHESSDKLRRAMEREVSLAAINDRLTGTLNRTGTTQALMSAWNQFRKSGQGCSAILLDLDHFKQINDTFGHEEGDRVLANIQKLLRPHLRIADTLGRWGGEEFLILVQLDKSTDLPVIVERLREAVTSLPAHLATDPDQPVVPYQTTASFGVSCFRRSDTDPQQAVKRADEALYIAKAQGRNRASYSESELRGAA